MNILNSDSFAIIVAVLSFVSTLLATIFGLTNFFAKRRAETRLLGAMREKLGQKEREAMIQHLDELFSATMATETSKVQSRDLANIERRIALQRIEIEILSRLTKEIQAQDISLLSSGLHQPSDEGKAEYLSKLLRESEAT